MGWQVVPWKRADRERAQMGFLPAWAAALPLTLAQATPSPITLQVTRALQPVIEFIQALGYPICFLYVSAGTLVLMTGHREKGLQMIKNAAIGYLALQFVPAIMDLLVQVSAAMRAANSP